MVVSNKRVGCDYGRFGKGKLKWRAHDFVHFLMHFLRKIKVLLKIYYTNT